MNITSLLFLTLECDGVGEAPITSLLCLGVTLLGEGHCEDDIPSVLGLRVSLLTRG